MHLRDVWCQADSESFQLSIRVVGELMQRDLEIETLEQLDLQAKGVGLHPASVLMDPAWHVYVLAAAWAKHKYPKAGNDGWAAFGSLISELTVGRIWADIDSEHWEKIDDRARSMITGDHRDETEHVFRQLERIYFHN